MLLCVESAFSETFFILAPRRRGRGVFFLKHLQMLLCVESAFSATFFILAPRRRGRGVFLLKHLQMLLCEKLCVLCSLFYSRAEMQRTRSVFTEALTNATLRETLRFLFSRRDAEDAECFLKLTDATLRGTLRSLQPFLFSRWDAEDAERFY